MTLHQFYLIRIQIRINQDILMLKLSFQIFILNGKPTQGSFIQQLVFAVIKLIRVGRVFFLLSPKHQDHMSTICVIGVMMSFEIINSHIAFYPFNGKQ